LDIDNKSSLVDNTVKLTCGKNLKVNISNFCGYTYFMKKIAVRPIGEKDKEWIKKVMIDAWNSEMVMAS
jgi:hypothetical protein